MRPIDLLIVASVFCLIATAQAQLFPIRGNPSSAIGETNKLSNGDNGNAGLLLAQNATLPQARVIEALSFYVTAIAGQLRLGLYDATGLNGGPGALLAQTAAFTPSVANAWASAPVLMPVFIQPGTYWLAYEPNSNSLNFVKGVTAGTSAVYVSQAFGSFPAVFPTNVSTDPNHWSFYATFLTPTVASPPLSVTFNPASPTVACGAVAGTFVSTVVPGGGDGSAVTYAITGGDGADFALDGAGDVIVGPNGVSAVNCGATSNVTVTATQQ